MPKPLSDAPEIEVTSRAALRDWLAANHAQPGGVWIVTYRKADPARHLPTAEIVDEALCWGWIDSLPRAKDSRRTMLYLAPRKPGSGWSRVNQDKVARLEAEGRIAPPGRAVIDRARADGSWFALDAASDLILPEDLVRALDGFADARPDSGPDLGPSAAPNLRQVWESWPPSLRRAALEQLLNAKRPETRAARIATIVEAAANGTRPFQWRKG